MVDFHDLGALVTAGEAELTRRGAAPPRSGGDGETERRRDEETEGRGSHGANGAHKANGKHQEASNQEPKNQEPQNQEAKADWKPSTRDEIVYDRVRYRGESQSHVALELGIAQGTVSRIVQRYDRWLVHAEPRAGGRLDDEERHRLQRRLTYELNQRLLASCLRIASAMEGIIDVSKTTIKRDQSLSGPESETRTTHATLDRSGIASRFLRLAFRINMEQLKLAALEPLEALAPLSPAELAQFEGEDAGDGARNWPAGVEGTGDREQGSGVGEQGSGVGDQGSGVGEQGSGVRDQESGVGDQGSGGRLSAVQQELVPQESCREAGAHRRIPRDERATPGVPSGYEPPAGPTKSADYARMAAPPAAEIAQKPPEIQRVFYGGMPSDDDPCWGESRRNRSANAVIFYGLTR